MFFFLVWEILTYLFANWMGWKSGLFDQSWGLLKVEYCIELNNLSWLVYFQIQTTVWTWTENCIYNNPPPISLSALSTLPSAPLPPLQSYSATPLQDGREQSLGTWKSIYFIISFIFLFFKLYHHIYNFYLFTHLSFHYFYQ